MMSFEVDVRDAKVLASLRNGEKRQAYAISNAINTTLLAIQSSMPEHMARQGFVVRKKKYMFGDGDGRLGAVGRRGGVANNISDFAKPKQGKLWGRIDVRAGSLSSNRRLLLRQFETGGTRKPATPGARSTAVPILGRPARPSIAQGVPPAFTFAGMRLRKFVGGKKVVRKMRGGHKRGVGVLGEFGRLDLNAAHADARAQWKGLNRTFLLTHSRGTKYGGVFQRIGKGRGEDAVRLIWAFVRDPQLREMLGFRENSQAVANRVFRPALQEEVRKTLEFQRLRGDQ